MAKIQENAAPYLQETDLLPRWIDLYRLRHRNPQLSDVEFTETLERAAGEFNIDPEQIRDGKEVIRRICSEISVFTLSARCDDILMYSHYAENHRGICIQIDTAKDDLLSKFCRAVSYSDQYPTIEFTIHRDPQKDRATPEELHALFYTKAKQWCYEEEWRVVRWQAAGTHEMHPDSITAIIFGCRISEEDEALIRQLVRGRRLELRRARPKEKSFNLQIETLGPA